jgi:hypothetical protein
MPSTATIAAEMKVRESMEIPFLVGCHSKSHAIADTSSIATISRAPLLIASLISTKVNLRQTGRGGFLVEPPASKNAGKVLLRQGLATAFANRLAGRKENASPIT